MKYLLSKILGKLFADPTHFYARVAHQIKTHPEKSKRDRYEFAIVMPDGGVIRFWIANEYYGFTRNSREIVPFLYKAMVYDAIRECADY